jgi:ABC-type sugar transport system substrate-binding protein
MTSLSRALATALTLTVAGLAVTACGSSNDNKGSSGSAGTKKSFSYAYSIPTGQNPWITAIANSARTTAAASGGKMDLQDAKLDPARAVQQVGAFINQGVNSITVGPAQVPQSLTPLLSKAAGQKIHIFALEWSFGSSPTAPPKAPVEGQASIDRGKLGADVAAAATAGASGGAKVIYVGLPFPVSSLDFFEANLRSHLTGSSKVVANVDNPTDNAQGALGPLSGALSAHPEANAIVTYNGPSALAGVKAVKAAGRSGKVKIYNIQLDTATAAAVRAGTITAAWDLNPPSLGKALGAMIAAAATGKPKSAWARTVAIDAPKYTKANIGSWKDWGSGS